MQRIQLQKFLFFAARDFSTGLLKRSRFFSFFHPRAGRKNAGSPEVEEKRAFVKGPRENDGFAKRISRSCPVVKRNFNPSSREGVTLSF